MAALVMLPSHDRKPRAVSHGPMESARHGMGLRQPIIIFKASDRSSIQLLMRKKQAVRGHETEKRDR